jgi:phosphoserine phosphatase RsbU/P
VEFAEENATLRPGDLVFLYTDGLVEAHNRHGGMFGLDRLVETVRQAADRKAEVIIDQVFEEVLSFSAGVPQADDMTAVALKIGEPVGR